MSVKAGGTWKGLLQPSVKVSGVWKDVTLGYIKESGVWKEFYSQVGASIPEGIIIPHLGASTPTGWTYFGGAAGKLIVAAGGSYAVGTTGGSNTVSISGITDSAGAHSGGTTFTVPIDLSGVTVRRGDSTEGAHTHSVSGSVAINPKHREYKLIRSGASVSQFPADGVVFGNSVLSINNVHAAVDAFIKSAATDGATGGSDTAATGTLNSGFQGNHFHGTADSFKAGTANSGFYRYVGAGGHSHTTSGTLTLDPKQVYLAAFSDSGNFSPEPGCIVMYEGSFAPEGWNLCDGTAGTLDLRDYFIRIGTTGNMGAKSGSNTASTGSMTTNTAPGHNHRGSPVSQDSAGGFSAYHSNSLGGHSHSVTASGTCVPEYYALSFIQKSA